MDSAVFIPSPVDFHRILLTHSVLSELKVGRKTAHGDILISSTAGSVFSLYELTRRQRRHRNGAHARQRYCTLQRCPRLLEAQRKKRATVVVLHRAETAGICDLPPMLYRIVLRGAFVGRRALGEGKMGYSYAVFSLNRGHAAHTVKCLNCCTALCTSFYFVPFCVA